MTDDKQITLKLPPNDIDTFLKDITDPEGVLVMRCSQCGSFRVSRDATAEFKCRECGKDLPFYLTQIIRVYLTKVEGSDEPAFEPRANKSV